MASAVTTIATAVCSRFSAEFSVRALTLAKVGCFGGAFLALSSCSSTTTAPEAGAMGTLRVQANGEDFVRQGFTTKDGWDITFDQVRVTLADIEAYQADPAFDPDLAKTITSDQAPAAIAGPIVVDLAAGEATAEPILVGAVETAAGRYNALTWTLAASDEPSLVMVGAAQQGDVVVPFEIAMDPALRFTCGDFIGADRLGFLAPGETAAVEATFHFDHLFGDGELPEDDAMNQGALGFTPFAELAQAGQVKLTPSDLEAQLSSSDYQQLQGVFKGLGHVGEGHCLAEPLA